MMKKKRKASRVQSSKLIPLVPSRRSRSLPYGPLHQWRPCPLGESWVREHPVHHGPSTGHPEGSVSIRRGHCRKNPTQRDQLYREEMEYMAEAYFPDLKGAPTPNNLGYKARGSEGNSYDDLIRGWTKYWNDILLPETPLDANLVKALIATESSFDANEDTKKRGSGRARGLMQITDGTRKILKDENGEIKDHYVNLTDDDAYDPNLNIAAGIRWLFHKKFLLSRRLKREATWLEAAFEYKSVFGRPKTKHQKKKWPEIRSTLERYYEKLKGETS